MLGLNTIGLQYLIVNPLLRGIVGKALFDFAIFLGILVVISFITTRIIKLIIR